MTLDALLKKLRRACFEAGGQVHWAKQHGVSAAYVSDVLRSRREPGDAILTALGVERVVTYRATAALPFVYLAACQDGRCKLGFSRDPQTRVNALAKETPGLVLIRTWQHRYAFTLEAAALKAMNGKRVSGEWIAASPDEIIPVVNALAAKLDGGEIKPSLQRLRKMGDAPPVDRASLGKAGGAAYVASETKRVLAAVDTIRDDWQGREHTTDELCRRAGLSYGVARRHLGRRPWRKYGMWSVR